MPDKTLTCVDCAQTFPFTEEEQTFFEGKGFNPPKRCKPCRVIAKQARESQPLREGGGEGGRSQRDQGRRERHSG